MIEATILTATGPTATVSVGECFSVDVAVKNVVTVGAAIPSTQPNTLSVGPGFRLVGNEIRYDFQSLARG